MIFWIIEIRFILELRLLFVVALFVV